jgi:hypothetical protein
VPIPSSASGGAEIQKAAITDDFVRIAVTDGIEVTVSPIFMPSMSSAE